MGIVKSTLEEIHHKKINLFRMVSIYVVSVTACFLSLCLMNALFKVKSSEWYLNVENNNMMGTSPMAVYQSRIATYIIIFLCVLVQFAVLLSLIFRIRNTYSNDMAWHGVLAAMGYTKHKVNVRVEVIQLTYACYAFILGTVISYLIWRLMILNDALLRLFNYSSMNISNYVLDYLIIGIMVFVLQRVTMIVYQRKYARDSIITIIKEEE